MLVDFDCGPRLQGKRKNPHLSVRASHYFGGYRRGYMLTSDPCGVLRRVPSLSYHGHSSACYGCRCLPLSTECDLPDLVVCRICIS